MGDTRRDDGWGAESQGREGRQGMKLKKISDGRCPGVWLLGAVSQAFTVAAVAAVG